MEEPTPVEQHHAKVLGEGKEYVVFSHGFGTNQSVWKRVHPKFLKDFKVILFDLMGAYSTNPEAFDFERYATLDGYADDLLILLDDLGVRECTYVGHSISGMIGVIAASKRPQLFRRLVLLGASPRYMNEDNYIGGLNGEDLKQLYEAMQSNYKAWAAGYAPLMVGEDIESQKVKDFSRTIFMVRPDIALSTLKAAFDSDCRALLPEMHMPVSILQTAEDPAVPMEVANYMSETFPNARLEILPVKGHLPHLTFPDMVTTALHRHLKGLT